LSGSSVRIGEVGKTAPPYRRPQPTGVCPWGDVQTQRAIKIRTVKPRMFEGAVCRVAIPLPRCEATIECGGWCVLAAGHVVPCECAADEPGEPGTCPA
jgi:hypothetical protein